MRGETPEQVIEQVAELLERGDIDGVMTLYEPEATFAPQPGRQARGLGAIREALERFVELDPRLRGEITKVLIAGDVALVQNRWQLDGTQPDGAPVQLRGHSADVLRRADDGAWRILIDDPWGAG